MQGAKAIHPQLHAHMLLLLLLLMLMLTLTVLMLILTLPTHDSRIRRQEKQAAQPITRAWQRPILSLSLYILSLSLHIYIYIYTHVERDKHIYIGTPCGGEVLHFMF